MGLGRNKYLLDKGWDTKGTYHPILTARILGALRYVTTTVENSGGTVHNVILETWNDSVGARDIAANGCVCGCCECLLGVGS